MGDTINIIEQSRVCPSPSPLSVPINTTSLPLTFFDIPWLNFFPIPIQSLFFYPFPSETSSFTDFIPLLKRSLSLALHHFHFLAGHLITLDHPFRIVYSDGDSVSFTAAESDANFEYLSGDSPRDATEFYPLLPWIFPIKKGFLPLLAVRLTLFPNGMCIGLACHHVAADGRTFNMFIKTWASICKDRGDASSIVTLLRVNQNTQTQKEGVPFYDRSVIKDDKGLYYSTLLEQYLATAKTPTTTITMSFSDHNMVRSTFLFGPTNMSQIKLWILANCKKNVTLPPNPLSPYVLTCAFVWVCLAKSSNLEIGKSDDNEPMFFGFNAGGITRLDFDVPVTYFGNCVAFGRCMATRNELAGEDGIVSAAKAICGTIKQLDNQVLGGVHDWIKEWEPLLSIGSDSMSHVVVSGSPKLDLYATDFGWGRPKKIEDLSIDNISAISLTESRNIKGGIEVGLVLPKDKMDAFVSHFNQDLNKVMSII